MSVAGLPTIGTRLLALGRQPEVRAQRLRLGEAVRVVDRRHERHRGDRPDAGDLAPAAAQLLLADQLNEHLVQLAVLVPQYLPAGQHALAEHLEQRIACDELANAIAEGAALHTRSDHQTEHLQGLANLVLDVEQLALESPSVCQQQLHPVGAFALRMNLFEPARSHQLSKPACIVLVGLVALGVQHAGCVMGLQQHHRDAVLLQLAVQPGRPTGRLVADEQQPVRIRLKRLPDRFGVGGHTGLQRDLAVLGFDDADRSCGGGSVECGMVLHRGASSLAGCNNTPTLRLPVHHGEIARRWPNYAVTHFLASNQTLTDE